MHHCWSVSVPTITCTLFGLVEEERHRLLPWDRPHNFVLGLSVGTRRILGWNLNVLEYRSNVLVAFLKTSIFNLLMDNDCWASWGWSFSGRYVLPFVALYRWIGPWNNFEYKDLLNKWRVWFGEVGITNSFCNRKSMPFKKVFLFFHIQCFHKLFLEHWKFSNITWYLSIFGKFYQWEENSSTQWGDWIPIYQVYSSLKAEAKLIVSVCIFTSIRTYPKNFLFFADNALRLEKRFGLTCIFFQ